MAHGFVEQYARPAGAKNHGHDASRSGTGFKVDERRLHGFAHIFLDLRIAEIGQAKAATTAGRAHLAAALLLGNDGDRQADQRAHIGSQRAVSTGHHHHVVFAGQAGHDLHHARILGTGQLLHLAQ